MDQNGFAQFASVPNVAHRARVSLEEAQEALRCLECDDPNSADPDHAGRRLERVQGGWMVLNAEKHRKLVTAEIIREQTRLRVQRHREMKRGSNASVTPSEAVSVVQAEARAQEHGEAKSAPPARPLAPIHDTSHKKHAHCGRCCLHASLFGEFVRRRNHDNADREIRDWAMDVEREWGGDGPKSKVETGDAFDFWRARYEERWPAAAAAGRQQKSRLPKWAQS